MNGPVKLVGVDICTSGNIEKMSPIKLITEISFATFEMLKKPRNIPI